MGIHAYAMGEGRIRREPQRGDRERCINNRKILLRELGSGKVGYNKYELVNVMVRKMDETYLAGYISKAENIRTW
jgi:hypothetical protein